MKIKTLDSLNEKESGKILSIKVEGELKKRLLGMGLVKGTTIRFERTAPFGDPIEIKVKGYLLSLRKEDAKNIDVEID